MNKTFVPILTKRRTWLAILLSLALLLPLLTQLRASAVSDTTPMTLVDLEVDTNEVDVSGGEEDVNISGEMMDDLSGFGEAEFFYTSPSGQQVIEGDANSDEQFIDEDVTFPEFAEAGTWRLTFTLVDAALNSVTFSPDDLENLGFDMDIDVTSDTPDTTAPSLDDLTINFTTLDTGTSTDTGVVQADLSEDLSGLSSLLSIEFFSPSTEQKVTAVFNPSVPGEYDDGTYTANPVFPQYSEVGTWTAQVTLTDLVTNTILYDNSDLVTAGYDSSFTMTGSPDTSDVSVDSLDFSTTVPPPEDQSDAAEVTVVGQFSDNLSGIATIDLRFISQTSTQVVPADLIIDGAEYQFTTYFSVFAAEGTWLPEMDLSDLAGNNVTLSHTDLVGLGYDLTLDFIGSESETVLDDESVTTDTEMDGATAADPYEATVVTPNGGTVSIVEVGLTEPLSNNDFLVFDQQFNIDAPDATAADPLVLTFEVDSSNLMGETAATLEVFRDGVLVADCLTQGVTDPDPCVSERNTLGDGDVQLVVLTSHASAWVIGFPAESGVDYTFKRFKKQVKVAPFLNEVEDGRALPIKFKLTGGDHGLDVLPPEVATSQRINCSTFAPMGNEHPIRLTKNGDLKIKPNGTYKFKWKTRNAWEDTCRQLILNFSNGETIYAYFEFDD